MRVYLAEPRNWSKLLRGIVRPHIEYLPWKYIHRIDHAKDTLTTPPYRTRSFSPTALDRARARVAPHWDPPPEMAHDSRSNSQHSPTTFTEHQIFRDQYVFPHVRPSLSHASDAAVRGQSVAQTPAHPPAAAHSHRHLIALGMLLPTSCEV
jgi:hypothetical protein